MELTGKMVNILQAMLSEKGDLSKAVSVSDLFSALKISKRTLYYNLEKIDQWLLENSLGSVRLQEGICLMQVSKPEELKQILHSVSTEYLMSAEERHALALFYMALSDEVVSIEQFQEMFDVSRNTILADVKKLKEQLAIYPLDLRYSSRQGYSLQGEEFSLRKCLGENLSYLVQVQAKKGLYRLLEMGVSDQGLFHEIRESISAYEREVGTALVAEDADGLVYMIAIAAKRCSQGHHFSIDKQEMRTLEKLLEFQAVKHMVAYLNERLTLHFCSAEAYYITILFLGVKNFDFNSRMEEDDYIRTITVRFVENMEKHTGRMVKDRKDFLARLASHMGPMYYRLKYDIQIKNPLLNDIRQMYKEAFDVASKSLAQLEGGIKDLVTDHEIAYLAIYIFAELFQGRDGKDAQQAQPKVLVVCGAGVAASVLIRSQLMDLMGEGFQFCLCPARRLAEQNMAEYDLVVSTLKSEQLPAHTVYVSAVLSEQDKRKIIEHFNTCPIKPSPTFCLGEVMSIIKKESKGNLGSREMFELNYALCRFFHQG